MRKQKVVKALFGLLFIVLGVGLAGKFMGWWPFEVFFDGWWTLFIIVPSILSMVHEGVRIYNSCFLLVGVLLLFSCQSFLDGSTVRRLIFPAILVVVGVGILLGLVLPKRPQRQWQEDKAKNKENGDVEETREQYISDDDFPDCVAVFSGHDIVNRSNHLKGGKAVAVFGGIDLDLREAKLDGDIQFYATAVFGGVEIKAPNGVVVEMNGVPIFGGNSNRAISSVEPGARRIRFICTSIFGGCEIS